jgi:hypothetical protein
MHTRGFTHITGKLYGILSAAEFLQLLKRDRDSIKTSKFIPPKLGTKSLGKFYVEYYYVPKSSNNG